MSKAPGHTAQVPQFERLNYFYGQVLGHAELKKEQAFFREKLRLHNRCLHGWGVVCGLEVTPLPPEEPCPPDPCKPLAEPAVLEIGPGFALDGEGNELVVRQPIRLNPWCLLDDAAQSELEKCERATLYLSICFKERPVSPVRPGLPDACGTPAELRYSLIRDDVRVVVSLAPPARDRRCDGCCEACEGCCVELARIEHFARGKPISAENIHSNVRRSVETASYQFAVIDRVNWLHGFTYSRHEAHQLLRAGLELHFSKPIRVSTIQPGVADFWVVEGGDGRSAGIYNLEGAIEVDRSRELTHSMIYRQRSKETLQAGDRLIFTLRSAFLLDHCCRALDGEHIGGRVPYVGAHSAEIDEFLASRACACPPNRPGWTSGNGSGGGSFESWFYVRENPGDLEPPSAKPYEKTGGGR